MYFLQEALHRCVAILGESYCATDAVVEHANFCAGIEYMFKDG